MSKGWIKLHRQIMDHPFYQEERVFSRHEAWEYLLLTANHADRKVMIDGDMVTVERGSLITSIRRLQDCWKWSNTKVVKFLELLESEGMITRNSDTKKTVITIDKYDFYQGEDDTETTQKRHVEDAETTQKRTNKNYKNYKNEKNDKEDKIPYAHNVLLTEREYDNLCNKYGKDLTDRSIEYLSSYKIEKNYKTKSDNLTIQRWVVDAVARSVKKVTPISNAKPQPVTDNVPQDPVSEEEYQRIMAKVKSISEKLKDTNERLEGVG